MKEMGKEKERQEKREVTEQEKNRKQRRRQELAKLRKAKDRGINKQKEERGKQRGLESLKYM